MIAMDWLTVPSRPLGRCPLALLEMSTAMTNSAPSWRAASTGTGLTTPPSTNVLPPMVTGSNTPGTALDARTAWPTLPRTNTARSPVSSCVATAANGFFSCSAGLLATCALT